jgi:uncharacterized membrane protein YeaQ/YmgE (transglycosylase-associated protein family)
MGMLAWIVIGLVAGGVAKLVLPGAGARVWILTVVLGVFGAAVGGFAGIAAGYGSVNDLKIGSLLLAVLGSMLVLSGYRIIAKRA